eukprot:CAMPEP_0176339644 /NCGR_PEP_ID=MMETSP0126-20121128/943_1 /TAXON_ID=141414 ORGANISM="Strombidinopsis acuminatum, Strain SPMC142" /NCGR_SAMPLE_ID=MMETSP0126 /ASSEMBLY_ACC=CAM_ASM_000229 /LENGTH=123 /DNA_ID=CAMNT_0017683385 /DNA_START=230 /DNA_END=600 /DNA_ORIENTATION=+
MMRQLPSSIDVTPSVTEISSLDWNQLSGSTETFTGAVVGDRICLDIGTTTCVSSLNFFTIENESTVLSDYNGIFGLAPPSATTGYSLVETLIDDGLLIEPVVEFDYGSDASAVRIGNTDDSAY